MWVCLTICDWLHYSFSNKSLPIEIAFHNYGLSCDLFSLISLSTHFYTAKYTESQFLCMSTTCGYF